jgi:hypothetical protein
MRATLLRIIIWVVTAGAVLMMFWPLVREFVILISEPPPAEF